MKHFTLKSLLLMLLMTLGVNAMAETGTIVFGTNGTKIGGASVQAADDLGNLWTITTEGTTSFTSNAEFYQVGSSKAPATSIMFTTTLPSSMTVSAMSAKFGGFSGTKGTISLMVGDTEIGNGALNASTDVTVESTQTAEGNVLAVSVTGIDKGVKCYNITYTVEQGGSGSTTVAVPSFSLAAGTYWTPQTLTITVPDGAFGVQYTLDGTDPTVSNTAALVTADALINISATTTVKAVAVDGAMNYSAEVSRTYTIVPSIANTPETAYTTAEAIELINGTSSEQLAAEKVYVKGTVSKIDSYNTKYQSLTYWLDDNAFEVYSGKGLDNEGFASADDVEFGAEVIVYGNIKKYGTTYEFDMNNYLVSYTAPAPKELSAVEVSGTANTTTYQEGATFSFEGLVLTAIYSDGSRQVVTDNAEWTADPATLTAGTTQVTVTATYQTLSANTVVEVTVWGLESVEGNAIIVAPAKVGYVAMTTTLNGTYFSSVEIMKAGDKYVYAGNLDDILFRVETTDGQTTIRNTADGYYVQATAAKKVSLSAEPYSWSNDGELLTAAEATHGTLQYNTSSPRFTTYAGKVGQYATVVDKSDVMAGGLLTFKSKKDEMYYATFCSAEDVEFLGEGTTVYTATVDGKVVRLKEVVGKQVPANTGVVIASTAETALYGIIEQAEAIADNNVLSAAAEPVVADGSQYVLADNTAGLGFYQVENGTTIPAGKAYLTIVGGDIKAFYGFDLEDEATGLDSVMEATQSETPIFNLAGQRMDKARKGINIIGGKKVLK